MKTLSSLSFAAILLFTAATSHADPAGPFTGITFMASLSTESVSGSTATLHTVHINNKTIADAIFGSGTTPALNATKLVLVLGQGSTIYVIDTTSTNDTVVSQISSPLGSEVACAVLSGNKPPVYNLTENASGYLFMLPGVANPQVANIHVTAKFNPSAGTLTKATFIFNGGNGSISAGATLFQGSFRQTSKVYP